MDEKLQIPTYEERRLILMRNDKGREDIQLSLEQDQENTEQLIGIEKSSVQGI